MTGLVVAVACPDIATSPCRNPVPVAVDVPAAEILASTNSRAVAVLATEPAPDTLAPPAKTFIALPDTVAAPDTLAVASRTWATRASAANGDSENADAANNIYAKSPLSIVPFRPLSKELLEAPEL